MIETNSIHQGWECPKCNRVYSPTIIMCIHCPTRKVTTNGTSSISFTHSFSSNIPSPTNKTKCSICGLEKWQHPNISNT
jgi:hypothetical protein